MKEYGVWTKLLSLKDPLLRISDVFYMLPLVYSGDKEKVLIYVYSEGMFDDPAARYFWYDLSGKKEYESKKEGFLRQ